MEIELPRKTPFLQQELFPDLASEYQDGRDELNLAEFPIAAVGSRHDPSVKTMTFRDVTYDNSVKESITRTLTVTGSDSYGLPTCTDDEVLLGLLQLTRFNKFESRTVFFTPYQLLKLLGWRISTNNYRRLKDSITRWLGVTMIYDNAWRDKKTGMWVDSRFHFLEAVEFYKPGHQSAIAPDGCSMFMWNEVVFNNFRAGNLKTLDFELFRSLKSGIAKRMFRFLDKRFYKRGKLVFDLETFACEKIGITRPVKRISPGGSPVVDINDIKRRLIPAIRELEELHFLSVIPPEQRFIKRASGWEVRFERYAKPQEQQSFPIDVEDVTVLEGRLIGHGITRAKASQLTSEYDSERVENQLEALEYLLHQKDKTVPENRAGWLVKAIEENYGAPRGYKSRAQREKDARERAERAREREEKRKAAELAEKTKSQQIEAKFDEESKKVEDYLAALSPERRAALEQEAILASPLGRGRVGAITRKHIIHQHVLGILKTQPESP